MNYYIMVIRPIPNSPQKHLAISTLYRLRSLVHYYSNSPFQIASVPKPRGPTSTNTKNGSYLLFLNSGIAESGRNGNLDEARSIFDSMPFRDVVSWTAMLTVYAENGDVLTARKVFEEMPERNTVSWNAMISAYIRESNLSEAFRLFSNMTNKNVKSYGTMMMGFVRSGMLKEAKELYMEMPSSWRDPVGSNALICGYMRAGEVEKAFRVFEGMTVRDVFTWSSMVDGFCKNGRILEARETFERMPERNVVSWTVMVHGYLKLGRWEEGFRMFLWMRREGVQINATILSVIIDACGQLGNRDDGVQIHGLVVMMGFTDDVFLGNSIITMYSRGGCMDDARKTFDTMSKRDIVSWNSLIDGYVRHDAIEEAYELFGTMPEMDTVSWTSMVMGFSSRGWINDAVKLFEQMPEKDDVAWTAIISQFAGSRNYECAFQWFHRMLKEGIKPNPHVLSSVLSALAGLAILEQGVQAHAFVVKMNLELDVAIQNSLVMMYAKCGNLRDAYRIFSSIGMPNLVSMNSMITGFAAHGLAKEAMNLFREMEASGLKPNDVTFLGVLSACSRSGLVKEGYDCFKSMSSCYGVEPRPDHFTCMVDLLGRAGLLKEAVELINSMPFEPHSAIWGALLNASSVHFNLEIARLAADKIFELEPNNATPYAVLSNMYSLAGLKETEEEVRMNRHSKGVKKSPGCSWIMLDNIAVNAA